MPLPDLLVVAMFGWFAVGLGMVIVLGPVLQPGRVIRSLRAAARALWSDWTASLVSVFTTPLGTAG